eukprot:1117099-Prymnesium_polylepis.1
MGTSRSPQSSARGSLSTSECSAPGHSHGASAGRPRASRLDQSITAEADACRTRRGSAELSRPTTR